MSVPTLAKISDADEHRLMFRASSHEELDCEGVIQMGIGYVFKNTKYSSSLASSLPNARNYFHAFYYCGIDAVSAAAIRHENTPPPAAAAAVAPVTVCIKWPIAIEWGE